MELNFDSPINSQLDIAINHMGSDDDTGDGSQNLITFESTYYNGTSEESEERDLLLEPRFSVSDIMSENHLYTPRTLLVRIKSLTTPYPYKLMENGTLYEISVRNISISDENNNVIRCFAIPAHEFESIELYFNSQRQVLIQGCPVSVFPAKSRPYYIFYIKKIIPQVTPLDLIMDNDYMKDEIKMKVEHHSQGQGIRSFIRNEVITQLHIKGVDKAEHLSKSIDFMILQSLSRGMSGDGRYSNKLHSLVIGAPASGKKLLTLIGRILNPISYQISSTGSKITPAGLIGKVMQNDSGISYSKPGYFPRANQGLLCIEDYHEVAKNRNELSSIFSVVMENGIVQDSTSAMAEHEAVTSLHIDMNRLSQVISNVEPGSYEDLPIPRNILSRFDFIIEIPADIGRQWEIALAMAEKGKLLETGDNIVKEFSPWQKTLRRIIAYISTEYSKAAIDDKTANYIVKKFSQLRESNQEFEKLGQDGISDMLTRIINTIEKYAKAIACAELKTKVSKKHVDEAFDLLSYKLDFLAQNNTLEVPIEFKLSKKDQIKKRQKDLHKMYVGKTYSVKELLNLLHPNNPSAANDKKLRRDIEQMEQDGLVQQVENNKWHFVDNK